MSAKSNNKDGQISFSPSSLSVISAGLAVSVISWTVRVNLVIS